MNDKNLSNKTWNDYLSKYKKQYRTKKDADNITVILCKRGLIMPYSVVKKQLVGVFDFDTSRQLTGFKQRCGNNGISDARISQEGDTDISLVINEVYLPSVVFAWKVKKRKNLTDEQLKVLSNRMKKLVNT